MAELSTIQKWTRHQGVAFAAILASILALDLRTPRGFSHWALYLLVVILATRFLGTLGLVLLAGLACGCTVLGLLLSPPGQPLWVSAISRLFGLFLLWAMVGMELSRRKKGKWLRSLEKAVSGSNDIVFMADLKGVITFINPAFTATYGYSEGEVVGKATPRILKGGQVDPEAYKAFWEMLLEKRSVRGEFINKTKDGRLLTVEVSASAITDDQGNITGFLGIQRDVTEHKRADAALRENERKYRELVQHANSIILHWTRDGRILFLNEFGQRFFGYTESEICGRHVIGTIVPETGSGSENLSLLMDRICASPAQFEQNVNENMRRNGERVWIAWTNKVEPGVHGQEAQILSIGTDITERKQAEEELQRLNRALKTISECNQALVRAVEETELLTRVCQILVDHGGFRLVWVGYTEQDEAKRVRPVAVAGQEDGYIDKLQVSWADDTQGRGPTGTAIRTGRPSTVRDIQSDPSFAPWREKALRCGYLSSIALPLIANGQTLGAISLYSAESGAFDSKEVDLLWELANDLAFGMTAIRNRHERKRAEQSLKEYKKVVEGAREMVMVVDRDYRFRVANHAFLAKRGLERSQVLGKTMLEVLVEPGMFESGIKEKLDECFQGKVVRFEMKYACARQGKRDLSMAFYPIEGLLGVDRVACVMEDISEKVEAERQLKKAQEQFLQAQKMEAMGRLAGGVAHDFNNLLTVINGYCDLMLEYKPAGNPEHDHLQEISQAGRRAAALTRQLLTFSRKQVTEARVLDLNSVVEGAHKMLLRIIGEDIKCVANLAKDLGHTKADPGQVEQVIMNLVVNARDAMHDGGTLTIETSNTELGEDYARSYPLVAPGPYLMLALSDTGCGMSAEIQSHIFEPFYTTKEGGKGTGLGLSTVYGIVNQSGGHINVYSEVGKGTTFRVYFPRIDQPVEKVAESKGEDRSMEGKETVLLVEDESGVRNLAQRVLQTHGYTVMAAGAPDEALARSLQHDGKIDLLLTDVVMPGMNGKDLADQLALSRPDLAVLFISGYTADAIGHHGILEKGVSFLAKPFTPRELLRKVRQALNGSTA